MNQYYTIGWLAKLVGVIWTFLWIRLQMYENVSRENVLLEQKCLQKTRGAAKYRDCPHGACRRIGREIEGEL